MGRPRGSKNKPKESTPVVENQSPAPEVPEESSAPSAKPAYLDRSALLKEISDSNKERYAAESTEDDPPSESDQQDEHQYQENTEPEDTSEQIETAPVEPVETPPVQAKQKLIIDGIEKEFTHDEIIALAQKASAVDARLAEANRIREDAKREAATLRGAQPNAATRANDSNASQPSSTSVDVGKITKALISGTEEEIQQAVSEILSGGRQTATQPSINPMQIHGLVSETLAFERAKALLETPSDQGGFADIYTDPMLRTMFEKREAELRDGGDARSYQDLYKHICTELRTWRDDLVKKHSAPTGLEDRDKLKRATGIVRGGGGKVPAPVESAPKTLDEKLEGMRRTRGLNH